MRQIANTILTVLFAGMLATSVCFIAREQSIANKAASMYGRLADTVNSGAGSATNSEDAAPPPEESSYSALYAQNSDMVGWIRIEDTNVNYPVMQSVNNPNFYLKHGFDKSYSDYGCPYVQENCNVQSPSDNVIIYGHNRKDGSMFADLEKFKSEGFRQSHRTFTFDTLTEHHVYEIVAVFQTVADTNNPAYFRYHHFVDAASEREFDNFIARCKKQSLYETGVNAKYGDKLVTLSTCDYSSANGRLVLVGKRVADS